MYYIDNFLNIAIKSAIFFLIEIKSFFIIFLSCFIEIRNSIDKWDIIPYKLELFPRYIYPLIVNNKTTTKNIELNQAYSGRQRFPKTSKWLNA